ncbi:MAG TPA: hypothetical protein DDW29_15430 [Gammaproteobacteria bacterium]|nr:hypothetical protein [Gammaproteobacteria bacterium]
MSIWWFIGLSQITLISVLGCIFWSIGLKNSKKQNTQLKAALAKAAQDYNDFVESIQDQINTLSQQEPQNQPKPETKPDPQAYIIARVVGLQNELNETHPHLESFQLQDLLQNLELQQGLEKLITNVFINEGDDKNIAQQQWKALIEELQEQIGSLEMEYRLLKSTCDDIITQWAEKKEPLHLTFDNLVKNTQKADNSDELHTNLNLLYNSFIELLNLLPELHEAPEDALLKMEAVDTPVSDQDIPTLKPLGESTDDEISPDDILASVAAESTTEEMSPDDILASVAAESATEEMSPDDILASVAAESATEEMSPDDILASVAAESATEEMSPDDILASVAAESATEEMSPDDILASVAAESATEEMSPDDILASVAAESTTEEMSPDDILASVAAESATEEMSPDDILASVAAESAIEEESPDDILASVAEESIAGQSDIDDLLNDVAAQQGMNDISPDALLSLSEDHDEDELPAPASAIEEFEPESADTDSIDQIFANAVAEQLQDSPQSAPPSKEFAAEETAPPAQPVTDSTQDPEATMDPEKMLEESLGVDNDIFDDLMSAMDEAIAGQEEKDQKQS